MARAKIELFGSITHTVKGRTFKKGYPQIITEPAEIKYYQSKGGFRVTVLDDERSVAKSPKPVVVESAPTASVVVESSDEKPKRPLHSKEKLRVMKKADLIELAAEFEILLDGRERKTDMVKTILEAQGG